MTKYRIVDESGHVWVMNYESKEQAQKNATRLSKRDGVPLHVESYKAPAHIRVRVVLR